MEAHPELYSEWDRAGGGDKPERKLILERGDDESAHAFLLRSYKDYDNRVIAQSKALHEKLRRDFEGLAGSLSVKGFDALTRSNTAASRMHDLIGNSSAARMMDAVRNSPSARMMDAVKNSPTARMMEAAKNSPASRMRDILGERNSDWMENLLGTSSAGAARITHEPIKIPELPEMPRNPIYDTNKILAEVAASTGDMRELYFQQADMQRNLNTVATEILNNFVTGAMIAERNSKRAIWVAVAAVAVAVLTFAYSQFFDDGQDRQIAKQSEIVSTLREIRDDVRSSDEAAAQQDRRLIEFLDRIEEQTSNPTRPSR